MEGRNHSGYNTPFSLYSEEEIKKLAKQLAEGSQFSEESCINLIKAAYIPIERKPIRIDNKHDVIYFAADDNLKMPENTISYPDSNTSLRSGEGGEEFNKFNDFFLSNKNSIPIEQKKENVICLVENDSCKDGIERSITAKNNDSSQTRQSINSTNQIYNALRHSSETFDLPDRKAGFSYKGDETIDRTMKQIHHDDIPPGYKRMTMWCHELQDFGIATVPEDTPELTNEEYARHSSINPI